MERRSHRPSCAHRLRREAAGRGQSVSEIALAIHDHCLVSLLRAHRLARGLTLKQAVDGLNELTEGPPRGPGVDTAALGHWETDRRPHCNTIRLLCTFYECESQDLGFDLAVNTVVPLPSHDPVPAEPALSSSRTLSETGAGETLEQRVDAARRSIDRTLAAGTVSTPQLDLLDEQVLWARKEYVSMPPAPMLKILLDQLAEVGRLAAERQPASMQARLSELTAMLATLIADALMKLGELTRSQTWFATARNAADDSGNAELRARVRAQAAMLPFYYGPVESAVSLAREARILSRSRPSATAAFAAAAEARALAQLGDSENAESALRHALLVFEKSCAGVDTDNDAFAFPERRLLLYKSGTLTALGRTSQTRRVQEEALRLYPRRTGIDPTLLRLEAALCLALDRSPTEACQLAGATFLEVDPAHRTPIVEERARNVIDAIPPAIRGRRAARELREILALPPGQM